MRVIGHGTAGIATSSTISASSGVPQVQRRMGGDVGFAVAELRPSIQPPGRPQRQGAAAPMTGHEEVYQMKKLLLAAVIGRSLGRSLCRARSWRRTAATRRPRMTVERTRTARLRERGACVNFIAQGGTSGPSRAGASGTAVRSRQRCRSRPMTETFALIGTFTAPSHHGALARLLISGFDGLDREPEGLRCCSPRTGIRSSHAAGRRRPSRRSELPPPRIQLDAASRRSSDPRVRDRDGDRDPARSWSRRSARDPSS